jgi:splicing factor 3B subunit 3
MTGDKDQTQVSSSAPSSSTALEPLPTLYLNVGLSTGVLIRVAVDSLSGSLTDSRQRFLGPRSVRLFRIPLLGQAGVMALTTRPWVMYSVKGRYFQSPVTYETLEYVSPFSSEQCPEGIVAIAGSTLRIITVNNLGEQFNQTVFPLRYTPRKICRLPDSKQAVVIESDHNEYSEAERAALAAMHNSNMNGEGMDISNTNGTNGEIVNGVGENKVSENEDEEATVLPVRGPVPPAEGKWASCIRVMEPASGITLDLVELNSNEAAFSICTCRFTKVSEETFVIVGVARDLVPQNRRMKLCLLKVHRLLDGRLQMLHQTEIDDVPQCMIEFQGRLLVGAGKSLRMYDLGKKKLLLKCENKLFPSNIIRLLCSGDRVYVGDMTESIHFVKYRRLENTLSIFADDTFPRLVYS